MTTEISAPYDHPNNIVTREALSLGAAGTGTKNRWRTYQKMRLKATHFVVRTAGTANAFTAAVIAGTTTVGTQTIGTATAGVASTLLAGTGNTPKGVEVAAESDVSCTIAGDATGVVDVIYEYHVMPGALHTA